MYIPEEFRRTIKGCGYLTGSEILTLDSLLICANHKGISCSTLEDIAKLSQMTVRTQKKYIKSLEEKGVITEKALYKEPSSRETKCIYAINLNVKFWIDKAKNYLKKNPGYIEKLLKRPEE